MNTNLHDSFLQLVRLGIGTSKGVSVPKDLDWPQLKKLADNQGLSAVLLDGIDKLPADNRPSQFILLEWIGEVLQNYEQRYVAYEKAIGSLAGFYNRHGLKVMVLKGYACSIEWPKPEHRPCGDIDIWLFGKRKEADALLSQEKNIKIDNSHHHHTVFYWRDFMVENHYDFVNVHHNRSNASIEKVFKEFGRDDTHFIDVLGEKLYIPSPNLHALFLLRHSLNEFASSGITLRQVIDWAFFVEKHSEEIDWKWLNNQLEKYYMKDFFTCINAICVEDLGFELTFFSQTQINHNNKERVLKELIEPAIPNEKPHCLLKRVLWKIRRWNANKWKQKLCYKESRWSSFWCGIWNHLLKPSSI